MEARTGLGREAYGRRRSELGGTGGVAGPGGPSENRDPLIGSLRVPRCWGSLRCCPVLWGEPAPASAGFVEDPPHSDSTGADSGVLRRVGLRLPVVVRGAAASWGCVGDVPALGGLCRPPRGVLCGGTIAPGRNGRKVRCRGGESRGSSSGGGRRRGIRTHGSGGGRVVGETTLMLGRGRAGGRPGLEQAAGHADGVEFRGRASGVVAGMRRHAPRAGSTGKGRPAGRTKNCWRRGWDRREGVVVVRVRSSEVVCVRVRIWVWQMMVRDARSLLGSPEWTTGGRRMLVAERCEPEASGECRT